MTALPSGDLQPRTTKQLIRRDIMRAPLPWTDGRTVSQVLNGLYDAGYVRSQGTIRDALNSMSYSGELVIVVKFWRGRPVKHYRTPAIGTNATI